MKRFIFLLTAIFICTIARADNVNINWIVGDNTYATTQCEMGNDLILPTPPTKTGYTFRGWRIAKYIPIEYLKPNGLEPQWIDTGVIPNQNTRIKAKYRYNETTRRLTFGVWKYGETYFSTFIWDTKYYFIYGGQKKIFGTPIKGDLFEIDWNKNIIKYTINNSQEQTIIFNDEIFSFDYDLRLFAQKEAYDFQSKNINDTEIYYLKIYDNDVLVRDFIPVIDNDGVPCMYDKVEGKFYYNQGTGQFIAGPIINE